MNYHVIHVTRYTYGSTVELTTGTVRLKPVSRNGQALEWFSLITDPPCLPPAERIDAYGNTVLSLRIEDAHRELTIKAASRVRIDRPATLELSPPWETVAAEALVVPSLAFDSPAIGIYPSRALSLFSEATEYALASFVPGRPVYEAAMDVARRIHADFVYDPEATEVSTPAHLAFQHRHGVCQDFAHIMIAALRGLGLPALYVSGYIRTVPPPGKKRLAGADASHAWVSVWCGRSMGWIDFDPTNALAVHNDHVEVARGRDYTDASPIESMVLSSGSHELKVEVDVVPA
jgi:transglutaminase-like putative cysteine protease